MKQSAIVIGAGIGGIATATHLAQHGWHVTVLEKNKHPGGRCDQIHRAGHKFDSGPTLLVMPLLYEVEFSTLGSNLHEMLDLQRVDPTYHLVFEDGSTLALTSDRQVLRSQLEAIQPGSYAGFVRYYKEGHQHYRLAMDRLVNRDFRKPTDFFNAKNLPLLHQLKPLRRHYRNMGAYFEHPRLKAAFTFQDVYMGLSPFDAPATFSMMPYTELAHGVWYPKGGMYRVVEALMTMARQAEVEFEFNAPVERIALQSSKVDGVVLKDGRHLNAQVVIANADLPYVYQHLLPKDGLAEKISRKRFSCSVISFFWGVDKRYDALGAHTLFLADDYRRNFESIVRDLDLPENPSLYIHAPARLDPGMAPPGEDTLIAIVPVGHLGQQNERKWVGIRDRARQAVFRRLKLLGITDLQDHLKFELTYTPQAWRKRYNLMKGSTHGLSHNLTQLGYFRPSNRHPRYFNLYFVGASTHPGTGVPTALVSARLTSQRVVDEISDQ